MSLRLLARAISLTAALMCAAPRRSGEKPRGDGLGDRLIIAFHQSPPCCTTTTCLWLVSLQLQVDRMEKKKLFSIFTLPFFFIFLTYGSFPPAPCCSLSNLLSWVLCWQADINPCDFHTMNSKSKRKRDRGIQDSKQEENVLGESGRRWQLTV